MTVEPARGVPVDARAIIPAQPAAPALEDADPASVAPPAPAAQVAPAAAARRDRYADPWHLHSQACYWDVRSCAWVCP